MNHQCQCGDTHNEGELGVQYNLYEKIDLSNVECLNESEEGTGVKVFKPWAERLTRSDFVESDVDDEILFNIPFTGNVKLKGIIIVGGPGDTHPSSVKMFKNRPGMTFDEVETEVDQTIELVRDQIGVHEYPIKVVKFSSVNHLTLHFTGTAGADKTRIDYIGLKGEWTAAPRQGVVIATYELRPQASDHPQEHEDFTREIQ